MMVKVAHLITEYYFCFPNSLKIKVKFTMLKTIMSISGKPGLYKLISKGKNMLIVESLSADKKRIPAYGHEK